jgi:hypothetical protein
MKSQNDDPETGSTPAAEVAGTPETANTPGSPEPELPATQPDTKYAATSAALGKGGSLSPVITWAIACSAGAALAIF